MERSRGGMSGSSRIRPWQARACSTAYSPAVPAGGGEDQALRRRGDRGRVARQRVAEAGAHRVVARHRRPGLAGGEAAVLHEGALVAVGGGGGAHHAALAAAAARAWPAASRARKPSSSPVTAGPA